MTLDPNRPYKKSDLLEMDPLDLLDLLTARLSDKIPEKLTHENHLEASMELSKAMQAETYLSELVDRANIMKHKMKQLGDKDGAAMMQMRENVFKGHASRMKRSYEAISRLFTIKNQELQELKLLNLEP